MRRMWFHRHPLVATLALVVAVSAPGYLRQEQAINKANEAIEAVVEQRATARVVACEQDNTFARGLNGLADATIGVLNAVRAGTEREDARVFFDQQIVTLEGARVVFRDCSPAGLDRYYEEQNP